MRLPQSKTTSRGTYLGYRDADFEVRFAKHFDPKMQPLAPHVVEALNIGAQAPALFDDFENAGQMADEGYGPIETGYVIVPDGSMRVATLTAMPGVTPAMWDWWFAWHGSDTKRYKLWHPRAHLRAVWADGETAVSEGKAGYLGRTSNIDEYLGSTLVQGAIQFKPADEFGFSSSRDSDTETAICARIGVRAAPVDVGYLIHQVRVVEGGCEMRSRFWLGGPHIAARSENAVAAQVLPRVAARLFTVNATSAAELLVHCAQEMRHLAERLAALHAEFGGDEA